jgi:putative salt-induced outer membrane protein YdiY
MCARWPSVVSVLVLLAPAAGRAQTTPPVQQHTEHVATAPADQETVWTVSAGAVLNTGNTRSVAANLGSRLSLKRSTNVIAAEVAAVYGSASVRADDGHFHGWSVNTESLAGKARYDRFFTHDDAAFAALAGTRDRFAGLDLRFQVQVGYLRNLFDVEEKHRLWGEIGYDFTFDNFDPDPLLDPDTGNRLDGTEALHSVRAFVGYDNHLDEHVTFLTGLESLFDVQDADNVRLNWASELRSKVGGNFQVGLTFTLHFDNVPVPGTEKLDTITVVNLLYSLI